MRLPTGASRSARIALRLSQDDRNQIEQAVKTRGYESASALVRAAIRNELNGRPELSEA
jgi:Arc/MetJ-type ribon-helix-helix transcriptional regulator